MRRAARPSTPCGGRSLADRRDAGRAWPGLALLLLMSSVMLAAAPQAALDWQAASTWREPWRWWTAALVHVDSSHLLANGLGALAVAWFGHAAGCDRRDTAAWFIAWPLTQALLVLDPRLSQALGLSGVLHAGVAVAALSLVLRGHGLPRLLGAAVLLGLLAKLVGEAAWLAPVRMMPGWDFPVAVAMHASGAAAGLLCAGVAWATRPRGPIRTMPP